MSQLAGPPEGCVALQLFEGPTYTSPLRGPPESALGGPCGEEAGLSSSPGNHSSTQCVLSGFQGARQALSGGPALPTGPCGTPEPNPQ